ncbi:hypothetical protein P280DRAFT_518970 [Massarina eburnea CBS 473.64]|uniref:Zn(2)-C6 fungal-type domain-containing protein n=1 Tax=Massarina eburnea CBS 473.64 TaxID=1395130 RepID=A0A6A6RW38_9PLEO|nr:hypothetical protein P280DRAFT_518970 [Massarina eburnea CBS 473.64]
MAGGLRKYHTKSRNGCSQCKKRRKKCDMHMPRCGNCSKWGAVCDFTAWSAAVRPVYEKAFNQTALVTGLLPFPVPISSFDTEDVELLRHYATQSSLTLSPRDTLSLFQVSVPGEAKGHLYLMHSVLAFSALHLSFVDIKNRTRHSYVASKQHAQALMSFRTSVTEVTPYNGGAITVFSYLTAVYQLGLPIVFGFESIESPVSTFIDMLQVLRQAWTAVGTVQTVVETGSLHDLLRPSGKKACNCIMHAKGGKVVSSLLYFLETSPVCEPENRHVYREALHHWHRFFLSMPCKPPLWSHALVWPMTVPQAYFQLLLQKRPMALIIIANWIIGLYRAPNMWFNAWAKEVTGDIWKISDDETRRALIWPAEVCGVIPKKYHPQGCVCWECREGTPYTKIRDTASAVLVDRTRPGDSSSTSPPPAPQVVESFRKTPDWTRYSSSSPET